MNKPNPDEILKKLQATPAGELEKMSNKMFDYYRNIACGIRTKEERDVLMEEVRLKAEQEDPEAQMKLAVHYELNCDYAEAEKWYKKAVALNHAEAQFTYSDFIAVRKYSEPNHKEKAFNMMKLSAEAGFPPAVSNLGSYYSIGKGVSADSQKAFEWNLRAAELGDRFAINSIAATYNEGRAFTRNIGLAVDWYSLAEAKFNDSSAQYSLGEIYEELNRLNDAFEWYMKAAKSDYTLAVAKVGEMLADGKGVFKDPIEASKWLAKAAEAGNFGAQERLARLHKPAGFFSRFFE